MTPPELQRALATMPSRAAQTLMFRCVEGRTSAECAALYGVGLPQWDLLFLDAARGLAGQGQPEDDTTRTVLAVELRQAYEALPSAPPPAEQRLEFSTPSSRGAEQAARVAALVAPLRALGEHRVEVARLIHAAELAAATSPARARETWLRRVAVVLILAASIYVWWRDRDKPPDAGTHARPTAPR